MEAGAVPALLDHLVLIFDLSYSQQGLLGGSVYLALAAACPVAGECVLILLIHCYFIVISFHWYFTLLFHC